MSNNEIKKPPLKARGIRFSEDQWRKIVRRAERDSTGRTKPSDVVRAAVDDFLDAKKL